MRLSNSKKPDFSRAYSKANEILVKSSAIQTFPFSPKDLVKEQTPIACRSFKKARKYGVDITAFGSESAIIMSFQERKSYFMMKQSRIHITVFQYCTNWDTKLTVTIFLKRMRIYTTDMKSKLITLRHSCLCLNRYLESARIEEQE